MPRQPKYRFFTRGNPKGTITVKDRKYNYIGTLGKFMSGYWTGKSKGKIRTGLFTDNWNELKFKKK